MHDSLHFREMLRERGIEREWAERTILAPDLTENHEDGTRHFLKRIPEFGDRWLRVIVTAVETPEKVVTAFFDRRMGRGR